MRIGFFLVILILSVVMAIDIDWSIITSKDVSRVFGIIGFLSLFLIPILWRKTTIKTVIKKPLSSKEALEVHFKNTKE
jgi:hypothetical protein